MKLKNTSEKFVCKWGMIGCGDVAEVKSGPAFYKSSNSKLIAVMRRNGVKAKDYAERHNVPRWYDIAEDLINDPDVNVIYIATPPSSHAEYTAKAAKAKKPVYVEKPMASSYQECLAMIEICKTNNVPLFTAYYRRMLPYFIKAKEIIDSGILGTISSVNIVLHLPPNENDLNKNPENWRINPTIAGAGYFYDLASHQFDILDYFLGPIVSASGMTSNRLGLYEAEDNVQAIFKFENGITGSGSWNFTVDKNCTEDVVQIKGINGALTFASFARDPIRLIVNGNSQEIMTDFPDHVHQPLVETIIAELRGEGKCPSTGESAARTNWVMDKILNKH